MKPHNFLFSVKSQFDVHVKDFMYKEIDIGILHLFYTKIHFEKRFASTKLKNCHITIYVCIKVIFYLKILKLSSYVYQNGQLVNL